MNSALRDSRFRQDRPPDRITQWWQDASLGTLESAQPSSMIGPAQQMILLPHGAIMEYEITTNRAMLLVIEQGIIAMIRMLIVPGLDGSPASQWQDW